MTPKWHFASGLAFAFLVWMLFQNYSLLYPFLAFFGSFFIDFDHYLNYVFNKSSFSLKKASRHFHKISEKELSEPYRPSQKNSQLFIFHTLEVHLIIFVLGFASIGFWFLFAGMVFHSLLDIAHMKERSLLYKREFLLTRKVLRNLKH